MSVAAPRPEQVAALTRGQPLPLPPLPETTLLMMAEMLARAWNDLRSKHAQTLHGGSEAEVTSLLQIRLNALLDEDHCWEMLVCGVSRGLESISFNGTHLEKRPDLSIHLTARRFDFPLVVECKLMDRPQEKTVGLYCRDGLMRFVRGEYAWMSAEAFMLAYVRDNSTISTHLSPHLADESSCATLGLPQALPSSADLAHSHHNRPFTYLSGTSDPGPIILWHFWLPAT